MKLHRVFFYLTILLLPTQLGYHFWPDWAMVLGRRIDYLSPTMYLTDILIVGTLICAFPTLRIQANHLALLLFFIVNIALSKNPHIGTYVLIKILEYWLFSLYILQTKPKIQTILTILSIAVFYESCIAIAQFFLQHSIGGLFRWLGERTFSVTTPGISRIDLCFPGQSGCFEVLRSYGTFPHPNVLGGFLAIGLLIIINYELKIKNLIFMLGITGILLTFSRSAIVVFILGLILQKYQIKKWVVGICIFLSVISFQLLQYIFPLSESVVVRSELNNASLSMIASSPLFGVGPGNFIPTLPDYLVEHSVYFLQPVHNIYLLILSELGIIGVLLVLKLLHPRLTIPLVMLALIGLVDHYPLTLQSGQLFTVLLIGMSLPQPPDNIQSAHVQQHKIVGSLKHCQSNSREGPHK